MTEWRHPKAFPPSASNSTTNLPSRSVSAASTLNLPRPSFSTASTPAAVAASLTSPAHTGTQTSGSGILTSLRSLRDFYSLSIAVASRLTTPAARAMYRPIPPGGRLALASNPLGGRRMSHASAKRRRIETESFHCQIEALMTPVLSIGRNHSQTSSWTFPRKGRTVLLVVERRCRRFRRSASLSRLEGAINPDKPLLVLVDSSSSSTEEVGLT
ncbi:hypothetical protein D9756_007786 [Leucocoprinus leucothites]|uniref:Uncharacterized protein n=1 Tax=Leucocoprinus leucothites TaxID=201217 RepID=A0A8H5D5P2_9AGAR|nr:hypothetical protein D9756_007786 [Leucoagaricus leucothites]